MKGEKRKGRKGKGKNKREKWKMREVKVKKGKRERKVGRLGRKKKNAKGEAEGEVRKKQIFSFFYNIAKFTASLKPKWVSVKVPRKGALNIEMGRYGDSKNGFG